MYSYQRAIDACKKGKIYALAPLLKPADVNLSHYMKVAFEHKQYKVLEFLINFFEKEEKVLSVGTRIFNACKTGNVEELNKILDKNKVKCFLNYARVACKNKNFEILRCLIHKASDDIDNTSLVLTTLLKEFYHDMEIVEEISKVENHGIIIPYSMITGKDNLEVWKLIVSLPRFYVNLCSFNDSSYDEESALFGNFLVGNLILDANYDCERKSYVEIDEEEKKIKFEKLKYLYENQKIRSTYTRKERVLSNKYLNVERLKFVIEKNPEFYGTKFFGNCAGTEHKLHESMKHNNFKFLDLLRMIGNETIDNYYFRPRVYIDFCIFTDNLDFMKEFIDLKKHKNNRKLLNNYMEKKNPNYEVIKHLLDCGFTPNLEETSPEMIKFVNEYQQKE